MFPPLKAEWQQQGWQYSSATQQMEPEKWISPLARRCVLQRTSQACMPHSCVYRVGLPPFPQLHKDEGFSPVLRSSSQGSSEPNCRGWCLGPPRWRQVPHTSPSDICGTSVSTASSSPGLGFDPSPSGNICGREWLTKLTSSAWNNLNTQTWGCKDQEGMALGRGEDKEQKFFAREQRPSDWQTTTLEHFFYSKWFPFLTVGSVVGSIASVKKELTFFICICNH